MRFSELLKAVIFGIVEGITEWLPISSTGHLIILNELLRLEASETFFEFFYVAIQLGAIMAVPTVLWKSYFCPTKKRSEQRSRFRVFSRVAIGVLPAAIIGFALDDLLDKYLYNRTVVASTLVIYGVVFLFIGNKNKGRNSKYICIENLSYTQALTVGLFQTLSLIPGTSRSGSTFLGGYAIGISPSVSAEFSFLMAIPIMLGATVLKGGKLFLSGYTLNSSELIILAVSALSSFIVSVITVKFLIDFVKKRSLRVFGIYRIVLGITVLFLGQ